MMMEQAVRGDAASMLNKDQPLRTLDFQLPTRRDGAGRSQANSRGTYPQAAWQDEACEVAARELPSSCDLDSKLRV
jgi:hypothetical protein